MDMIIMKCATWKSEMSLVEELVTSTYRRLGAKGSYLPL